MQKHVYEARLLAGVMDNFSEVSNVGVMFDLDSLVTVDFSRSKMLCGVVCVAAQQGVVTGFIPAAAVVVEVENA